MEKQKGKISKKTTFAQLLNQHPDVAEILFEKGMHCIGCPMAMQETLEQGAIAHGINADKLVKEINEKLDKIEKNEKKKRKTSKKTK
jgi:hybrid cluster-associated redox disulfide protein